MTLAGGSKLGPYEIVSAIGAGGMGGVHKAQDTWPTRYPASRRHRERGGNTGR